VSAAERLLHWAAERGSGTIGEMTAAHAWAVGGDADGYRVVRHMVALGQVEVDWSKGTWGALHPAITLLPDAAGHGLVVGARTARMTRALVDGIDAPDVIVQPVFQRDAPDAHFVAADSERALRRLAEDLGMPFVHSVTERLASVLPSLDAMLAPLRTPPIACHYGLERYDLDYGWEVADEDRAPGLYRYELSGPRAHHFVDDADVRYRVDLAVGTWAEARRQQRGDFLIWGPDGVNGTLDAPLWLPLPALHARAAALCTGLAPKRAASGGLLYANVPRRLAARIAETLGQPLMEE
jgi:hypothetical protein